MDKCMCVTGADRGLGLGLARNFLEDGYTVFAGCYMPELTGLQSLKKEFGDRLHIVGMDIGDDDSVKKAAQYISSVTQSLEIIINNAAILGDIKATIFDTIDFEEIQKVFNVNAVGPLRVSNALISLLRNGDRKLIVNISSEAGSISASYRKSWFAYCMSKTAVNMESTIIHNDLKEIGGQVMVFHPGWLKTTMNGYVDEDATYTPEEAAEMIFGLLQQSESYKGDKPVFIDNEGNKMEW